jgi:predicted lipid-binding transport protein (Tim44 family)
MSEKRHPGISMHKLPVGGDLIGLLFAAGSALIFLFGLPQLWYFLALSAGLGMIIGLIMRMLRTRASSGSAPLSILNATDAPPNRSSKQRDPHRFERRLVTT